MRRFGFLSIGVLLLAGSGLVTAAEDAARLYGGVSHNGYAIDLTGASVDDTVGYGFLAGLELKNGLAVEVEYNNSGKTDFVYSVGAIQGGDFQFRNLAAYGVYRSAGSVYLKAKGGLTINLADVSDLRCSNGNACLIDSIPSDGAGLALAVGAGAALGERFRAELEYAILNQDVELYKASLLYRF